MQKPVFPKVTNVSHIYNVRSGKGRQRSDGTKRKHRDYRLKSNHINYHIKPGCSVLAIWDVEDPSNAANPPLCSVLLEDAKAYFTTVFQNSVYRVLKVN
ncbi:hypothetical protein H8959_008275 [Pygathrix nigripes]